MPKSLQPEGTNEKPVISLACAAKIDVGFLVPVPPVAATGGALRRLLTVFVYVHGMVGESKVADPPSTYVRRVAVTQGQR